MSEKTMRSRLVLRCKSLDMKPMENRVAKGTPDVNYVEGWLELKWLRGWPPQEGVVHIEHYTNHQRLWLKRRWERGGRAFLVLQVKKQWLVFCGCDALPVGTLNREDLFKIAIRAYERDLHLEDFIKLITAPMKELNAARELRGICNSPLVKNFSLNAVGEEKRKAKQRRASRSATTDTFTGSVVIPSHNYDWGVDLDD